MSKGLLAKKANRSQLEPFRGQSDESLSVANERATGYWGPWVEEENIVPWRPSLKLDQICRELLDVSPIMVEECLLGLLGSGRVEQSYAVGYELGYRSRNKP